MEPSIEFVKVQDPRVCVQESAKYAVKKGGAEATQQVYQAVSSSTSQLTFNIQVPSQETLIARDVMLRTRFRIDITGVVSTSGDTLVNYGVNTAFAPFPFSQLQTTATATINNNSVSCNVQDVLSSFILKMMEVDELLEYNSMAPVQPDNYFNLNNTNANNAISSYKNAYGTDFIPRGSFRLVSLVNPASTTANQSRTAELTIETTEPVFVSPFTFGKHNEAPLSQITNMNFVFNLGNPALAIRRTTAGLQAGQVPTVALHSVGSAELIFTYLTPQVSQRLSAKSIVPYYNLPRYITPINTVGQGTQTITFNNIQLNSIPDKLVIVCRKRLSSRNVHDTDFYLPIRGISINWNNRAGLLSSATFQDLYKYTKHAGANVSWLDYVGIANGDAASEVLTCGSPLVLDMGWAIPLEDYYAAGSLGNFQLQMTVQVENRTGGDLTNSTYELVLITMESGILVNQAGTSSVYNGILTKEEVLRVSEQEGFDSSSAHRLVGAGFLDNLKSVVGKLAPVVLPVAKNLMAQSGNKYAKTGAQVLGSLGYGASGGRDARLM
jgi:hypothetical protein